MPSIFAEVVDKDFLAHVDKKMKLYNPRGRTKDKLRMDIECEIHEFNQIKRGNWYEHEDWKVDAVTDIGNIDVKFINKWYNVSCKKMLNLIQQRRDVDYYHFFEWLERPNRPLREGDEVSYRELGILHYDEVMDNLQTSQFNGFYVDVRKMLYNGNIY